MPTSIVRKPITIRPAPTIFITAPPGRGGCQTTRRSAGSTRGWRRRPRSSQSSESARLWRSIDNRRGQLGARGVACCGMLQSFSSLSLLSEVRCSPLPPMSHAGRAIGHSRRRAERVAMIGADVRPAELRGEGPSPGEVVELGPTRSAGLPGELDRRPPKSDQAGCVPIPSARAPKKGPEADGCRAEVLALQLQFFEGSESMDHHDSGSDDWWCVG